MTRNDCLEVFAAFCLPHILEVTTECSTISANGFSYKFVDDESDTCKYFANYKRPVMIEMILPNKSIDCLYYTQQFKRLEKIIIDNKICYVKRINIKLNETLFTFEILEYAEDIK